MLDHPMAPSSMHGRHRNHGASATLLCDSPKLQGSSSEQNVEENVHQDREVQELHQMMVYAVSITKQRGTGAKDLYRYMFVIQIILIRFQ